MRQIGRWTLSDELGRGGMGVVFRATRDDGLVAALKTVDQVDPVRKRSLLHEVAALSRLRHPQIVRILDHGEDRGVPWYAMELVAGPTLREVVGHPDEEIVSSLTWADPDLDPEPAQVLGASGPRLPLAEALDLCHALCAPLAFLHGEGLVHRDVKLDNVRLRDGLPVLLDFGLAARSEARDALSSGQIPLGTPDTASPEQLRGEAPDPRTDLYALGCVLFELVTGAPPFVGTPARVLMGHLQEEPPPPSHRVPSLPPALDELCRRLLAKAPGDRPGSALDVAHALEAMGARPREVEGAPDARAFLYRPSLVGRGEAMAHLVHALEAAWRRQGTLELLVGPSGSGKTRLLLEVRRQARARRMAALVCPTPPPGTAGPSPLHTLLRELSEACRRLGPLVVDRVLRGRLSVLAAVEPELGTAAPPPPLPPEEARRRLVHHVVGALATLASEQPVVVLADDLQWAGEAFLDVVEALRGVAAEARLVVVATYRPEEAGERLEALARATPQVAVEALGDASVAALVGGMLAAPVPEGLTERVVERAAGSPFLAAELLRAALETGALARDPSGWRLATPTALDALPDSVADLLRARLAGLDARELEVLERAAVLGRRLEPDLLGDLGAARLVAATQELVRRQVLVVDRTGHLTFAHDRIREAVLGGVTPDVHQAAAEAVEASPQRARWLGVLPRLWRHAGEPGRARAAGLEAAEAAWAAGDHADAASLFVQALGLPGPDEVPLRTRVARELLVPVGRPEEALALLDAVPPPTDPARRVAWLLARAVAHDVAGRLPDAEAAVRGALTAARLAGGRELADDAELLLGGVLSRLRALDEAETVLTRVAARSTDAETRFDALITLAGCMEDDRLDEADAWIAAAEQVLPDPPLLKRIGLQRMRARVHLRRQCTEEAVAVLEPLFGEATAHGLAGDAGRIGNLLGLSLFRLGSFQTAEAVTRQALQMLESCGLVMSAGYSAYYLARIYRIGLGDFERAEAMAHRVVRHARAVGNAPDEAGGVLELAHVALARGEDPAPLVDRVHELCAGERLDGYTRQSLSWLERAMQTERRVRGEAVELLSPGIVAALERDGVL